MHRPYSAVRGNGHFLDGRFARHTASDRPPGGSVASPGPSPHAGGAGRSLLPMSRKTDCCFLLASLPRPYLSALGRQQFGEQSSARPSSAASSNRSTGLRHPLRQPVHQLPPPLPAPLSPI